MVRQPADGPAPPPARRVRRPQPHPPADASDGAAGRLSAPQDDGSPSRAPGLPLPAARAGDRQPRPGLVRGHHPRVKPEGRLYIPMRRGFLYLVAIMDWASRKVLAWRLSNTMEADFCIEALEEALCRFGRPGIFNTDQGSQFTSPRFVERLTEAGVRVSMDGRGRWMDNVFIERLWRSMKYECVYLNAFETGSELRSALTHWVRYYNNDRPHSALGGRTPDDAHAGGEDTRLAA